MSILAHKHTSRLLPSPAPRMSSHMSSHCSVPAGPRWCRPPRLHTSCGPEAIQFRRPGPARRALRGAGARASAGPQVEFMPYTLIKKSDQYDLRLMSAHAVAVTGYERRDEGFEALGSYMSAARMRETQPVVMTYRPDGSKTMQVLLSPRDGPQDLGQLPVPAPPVELDVAGGELLAALRFEGNATQAACEQQLRRLRDALQQDGLRLAPAEAEGQFRLAQYGQLFSLGPRLNEIWLGVVLQ